jgi:hypothetical protein
MATFRIPLIMRNTSDKRGGENQNTHFMFNNFLSIRPASWLGG